MHKLFDIDSPLMSVLSGIGDLILLNLLWLVTSLPVLTLGASTAALYSVLIEFDAREVHGSGTCGRYFRAFRRNFKPATLMLLVLLVPLVILLVDFLAAVGGQAFSPWLLLLPGLLFLVLWSYSFPLIAVFENKLRNTVKNALLLAIVNFPSTLVICLVNAIPVLLVLFSPITLLKTIPFWLFLGFALMARVNSLFFGKIFSRLLELKAEEEA